MIGRRYEGNRLLRAVGLTALAFVLVLSSFTAAAPLAGTVDVIDTTDATPEVPGEQVRASSREPGAEDTVRTASRTASVFPTAGTRRVALSRVGAGGTANVTIETLAPDKVARLGGVGLGVRVSRVDDRRSKEKVELPLDYAGFANAHGGGFAGRLRVLRMPGRTWIPARHDPVRQRFVVEVTPGPADEPAPVFMLAAAGGGSFSGNFGATDLAPSGSWQTGLSSGSFTYSYPIPVPASPNGKGPELKFQYSSSSVDGMTAATNAQSGWTGLGWQLGSDYIERRYRPCAEDANGPGKKSKQSEWGHFCWESPDENDGQDETTDPTNSDLYLSLNGRSSRIVKDRVGGGWKTYEDYGWKIEHLTGGASGQPYWQVTTQAGDVHRFGYRRDSMWQIPVAGDDPGEPCNDRYANSGRSYPGMCDSPWRWNLDQVVDANENLTTYHWKRESGEYRYFETEMCCGEPPTYEYTPIGYDRGGYLDRVEWGSNTSIAGSTPTSKVVFNMVSRCDNTTTRDDPLANPYPIDTGTGNLTCGIGDLNDWDVPDDLVTCGTYVCNSASPAFFIMRRLDSVVTYTLDAATGAWDDVHKLQLRFKYVRSPAAGSNGCCTSALWLDYIRPVGLIGSGQVKLPPVDFDAVELNGRVDWGPDTFLPKPKSILPRIATVHNGYGGRIEVTYGRPNACPDGGSVADGYYDWYDAVRWDRGNQDCFRTYDFWVPWPGAPEVVWGVYHKFHVTKVVERDTVAGSPDVTTSYEYQGRPAWARPVNYLGTTLTVPGGTAQVETASWSEARGYETVRTLKGSGTDPTGYTVTTETFFRGMFDDVYEDGTRKQAKVTDFDGGSWDDLAALTGRSLQTSQWTMTSHSPRQYAESASTRREYTRVSTGDGPGVLDPARVDEVRVRARQAQKAGGFRHTDVRTAYDTYGLPIRRNDYGADGVDTDNTCTATRYARSTSRWLISYPAVIEDRRGDSCTAGTITGRTEMAYDNATEPSDGNVTQERRYVDASRIAVTRSTFDDYGRVTSVTDPLNKVTTTAYSPAVGFPDAGVTATAPGGHATTTWSSRAHGQPVKLRDPQGSVTELDYDALGRATAVWKPGEPRTGGTPSSRMSYAITYDGAIGQPTAPVRTQTEKLLSGTGSGAKWQSSHTFDDGFGRVREAQTPSPAGGRTVVASTYDARGDLANTTAPMHNSSAPGSGLLNPAPTNVPHATRYVRDSAQRTAAAVQTSYGAEQRRVSAVFAGEDMVTVDPPTGGNTEYWFDADDKVTRTVELGQPGAARQTQYEYDSDGNVTRITDARGNVRTFQYDWLNRVVASTDPDSGNSTLTYDLGGRLVSTVDGRGKKVSYGYDELGRKTSQWAGDKDTGALLAEWGYDAVVKGELSSSTRWVGTDAYRYQITAYDADRRPTATSFTVPAAEGALAGTYSFTAAYNKAGQVTEKRLPGFAGLPQETVTATYTDLGLARGLTSDLGGSTVYVKDTTYTPIGKLDQRLYGALGQVSRKLTWDPATDRLTNITTKTKANTTAPVTVQNDDYFYDAGDNVVRVADKTAIVDGALGVQSECFTYDDGNRLAAAWTTTKADCSGGPQNSPDTKGPDPYRQAFGYDAVGNTTSIETNGRKGVFGYPATGSARPNAVTSVAYPDRTDSYTYDGSGQLSSRTVAGTTTTLTWDDTGQLSRTTVGDESTDHVYNADGERLVRRGPDGTTVYLGDMELHAKGSTVTATRYYVAGDGAVVAVRNSDRAGLTWLAADAQASTQLAVDDATATVERQRYLPFGGRRGGRDDITATERGFLGKTEDADTGLTLLSARYYDPSIGRFVSPDPKLDLRNPQYLNTYAYSGNNPVSRMDPSGMASCSSTNKKGCMPDADLLAGKQRDLAKLRQQCWYQGKNCDKLPQDQRTPPWKRVTKARTVEDALNALADEIGKSQISKAFHQKCLATVPDAGGRCAKAAEDLGKTFNRAQVKAFCGQYKKLCQSAAPDYITLSINGGKWGLYGEIALTVTRTGHVYFAMEGGVGAAVDVKGFGFAVKVGWVYDGKMRRATAGDVATFPQGAAASAGLTWFNGYLVGVSVTQTHHAQEFGISLPGISVGRGYGWLILQVGSLWTI